MLLKGGVGGGGGGGGGQRTLITSLIRNVYWRPTGNEYVLEDVEEEARAKEEFGFTLSMNGAKGGMYIISS